MRLLGKLNFRIWILPVLTLLFLAGCAVRTTVRHGYYPPLSASPDQAKRLANARILLAQDREYAEVACAGWVGVEDLGRHLPDQRLHLTSQARILVQNRALVLDRQFFPSDRLRLVPEPGQYLQVNGVHYRGALEVSVTGPNETLQLVNVLGVEDYLKGVVPNEMQFAWPLEALKAQAVAARTFTYSRMAAQSEANYDLEAGANSQVYRGQDSERGSTDQAVDETRGLVAVFRGRFISAFYHANCGGHTADVAQVWGGDAPYLSGVECSFCSQGPHYAWTLELPLGEVAEALSRHGQPGGSVRDLRVLGRGADGRVTQVEIGRGAGPVTVKGAAFRMLIGPDRVRSTNFEVQALGSVARLRGHGWGHGVGLCQEGAGGMARSGYGCEEILRHYYPGIELRRLEQQR